ncbi:MAG TPA: SpoIIE family protein phosphatase [Solirubrobacterales bacterium]|nr:SpoIIE family protein phosphatase [Solirubrobacterales bacterium]
MQPSRPEGASATVRDEEEIYRLAQVVRSTRDAVLSKDLDGVITSWNPGAVRLYGYSEEEAIGSSISLLIPADRKNEEWEILDRACRGEAIETYETERIRKDGARIDVSLTISPIEHPQRGIVGASVIARDITAESRRRRAQDFLVAATRGLDASLDFDRTARTIVRTAVPEMAELCVLDFVRRDGWVGNSVVGAADPAVAATLEGIRRSTPLDPRCDHPVVQVLRAGRPMVWRDLTAPSVLEDVVQSEDHRRLIEETHYHSAAVAPLVARGTTLGAISFLHASTDLRFDAEDLRLVGELADRAAMALDNARLYEERDRIAQNLQRGLRPPEPPYVPGLDIAVVFDAFGEAMEIGGDLYDVLPTEDGCWIMIGDVTGKGSVAAGVSVALRHSMRGLARQIDEPQELLAQLNEMLLEGRSLNDFATALLLRLRRRGERWTATLAAAGHPPAIHVTGEGSVQLGGGAVLGAWADAPIPSHQIELAAGETLVLATDGWFEAGPAETHVASSALGELAHSFADLELGEMTECLRQDAIARSGGRLRDDLVLLALRPGSD